MNTIMEKLISEGVVTSDISQQIQESFELKVQTEVEKRLEEKVQELEEAQEVKLQELESLAEEWGEQVSAEMLENVNDYLTLVVKNWISENQSKLDAMVEGKRVEAMSEGLKALMITSGVTMSEIEESIAEEKAEEIQESENIKSELNTLAEKVISLEKERDELAKMGLFKELTEGLTIPQVEKMERLAENITFDEFAKGSFDLIAYGKKIDHIQLNVAGIHNVSNALAAIGSARELHIPMDIIKKGLMAFEGTDRRFEYKGQFNGVTVIDDYAHHPTEIKATLTAAQKYPHRQIWCVFQPHTYTRTKAFFHEFADALSLADKIVLADIYAARETDPGDIHSRDIQKLLLEKGKEAYYFPSFEEIEKFLREKCINGDLLITMGAGDVVLVGEALIK